MQKIRKIATVVGALILIGALAGLFGDGPLSTAHVETSGLRLEYQRFLRIQSPTSLIVQLRGEPELRISTDYLIGLSIREITPAPAAVRTEGPWSVYDFVGAPQLTVKIAGQPEHAGKLSGGIQGPDGQPRAIWQWVYP